MIKSPLFKKLEIKINEKLLLFFLLVLAAVTRLLVMISTENYHGGDPMARIIASIIWLNKPCLLPVDIWGPLHFYIVGSVLRFWNNPLLVSRLISVFFGALTVVPFFYLIKILFNKKIALISSLLLVFQIRHIQYSTLSMAEVIFAFFEICALCLFCIFKMNKKTYLLALSGFFLTLACMLRYEGWILILPFIIFLFGEGKKNMAVFLFTAFLGPAFILISMYSYYRNPFYFFSKSTYVVNNLIGNFNAQSHGERFVNTFRVLSESSYPLIFFTGSLGMVVCLIKRRHLELIIVFIVFHVFLVLLHTMNSSAFVPRSVLAYALFLFPYSVLFIDETVAAFFKRKNNLVYFLLITYAVFTAVKMYPWVENEDTTSNETKQIAGFLKLAPFKLEEIVLDESASYGYSPESIIVYARLPPENCLIIRNYDADIVVWDKILKVMKGKKQILLVSSNLGKISKVVNLVQGRSLLKDGLQLDCLFMVNNCKIISVK